MTMVTPDELLARLNEADRRGRLNYTTYVHPSADHIQRLVKDLQDGLLLPDANKISQYFRMGWNKEKHRLAVQRMNQKYPELQLLRKTRAALQTTLNELTETLDRIENEFPDA